MAEKVIGLKIEVRGTQKQVAAVGALNKSIKDLTAQQKQLTKDSKQGSQEFVKNAATLKELKAQQRAATKEINIQGGAVRKLGNSYNALTERNRILSQRLRQIQDPLGKGKKRFELLSNEISKNTDKLKNLDGAMGRNFRNVGNYQGAIKKAGVAFGKLALGITAGIAAFRTLSRVFGSSLKVITNFQQANANLASILGKTRSEITALTKDAERLGASTAFTATEVSKLQIEFSKLGFNEKEILDATEATLALAAATGADLAQSATVAGATVRGFGLDASETQRVVDVMAKSFSSSALDLNKFQTAMAAVAPVAKNAGLSIEQTTAMLGTLVDRGIDASTAGTALRNILLDVAKEGMTLEEAFNAINTATDSNVAALDLFGKRGATVATILAENVDASDSLALSLTKSGGAAEKMAKTQLNTLEGKTKLLTSAWEGFILSIDKGDGAISRFLSGTVEALTSLLGVLSGTTKSFKEEIRATKTSALENRKLAVTTTALLDEYEALTKDGIKPTEKEKRRLDIITVQLKDNLGDSVIAIDEETGAFKLNTEAVKAQIKLKRLAADEDAATLASRLKGIQVAIEENEQKIPLIKQELEARKTLAAQAVAEFNATTKLKGRARLGALSRIPEEIALREATMKLNSTIGVTTNLRKEEALILKALAELNFSATDAALLFAEAEEENNKKKKEGNKITDKGNKKKKKEKEITTELGTSIIEVAIALKKQQLAMTSGQSARQKLIKDIEELEKALKRVLAADLTPAKLELIPTKELEKQNKKANDIIKSGIDETLKAESEAALYIIANDKRTFAKRHELLKEFLEKGRISKEEFQAEEQALKDEQDELRQEREDAAIEGAFQLAQTISDGLFQLEREAQQRRTDEALRQAQNRANTEQTILEEQLRDGILSETDYREKKHALDVKAQREERRIRKQAFEEQKTLAIIQATINTALAVVNAFAQAGNPILGAIFAAVNAAVGVAQIAIIASQQFAKGGVLPASSGGMIQGNSHANGGVKFAVGGVPHEAEGGEAIINKKSTKMYGGLLSSINQAGGGVAFAKGGVVKAQRGISLPPPSRAFNQGVIQDQAAMSDERVGAIIAERVNDKRVVVVEEDITETQDEVSINAELVEF